MSPNKLIVKETKDTIEVNKSVFLFWYYFFIVCSPLAIWKCFDLILELLPL